MTRNPRPYRNPNVPDLVARLVLADILMRAERDGMLIPQWAHDLAASLRDATPKA